MWKQSRTRYLQIALFIVTLFLAGFIAGAITANANDPETKIVTNEESGTIEVITKGKTIMTIDKWGVHVWGDLSYNGTITDGTPDHLKKGERDE